MHDVWINLQPRIGLTILATSLGFVLVQLDVSIVSIALAELGAELGAAVAGLQWVVDSYALAFAALLLSAGALGDQIGARKGLQMLPGFLVIPLGVGLAVPCMATSVLTTVPASRSGVASGVLNSVRQAGGALGVAVYGALLNEKGIVGAQLSFSISVALLLLAALVAVVGVKPMTRQRLSQNRHAKLTRSFD